MHVRRRPYQKGTKSARLADLEKGKNRPRTLDFAQIDPKSPGPAPPPPRQRYRGVVSKMYQQTTVPLRLTAYAPGNFHLCAFDVHSFQTY